MFIIPLVVMITLSCALTIIFNKNKSNFINESQCSFSESFFIVTCSIILLQLFFGLIGVLNIAIYIILACALVSFFYVLYHFIVNRKTIIIWDQISPSLIILVIAYIAYYIVVRDKMLSSRDEPNCWAYAVKYMYTTGKYIKMEHPNGMALFSLFITKVSNFNEEMLFLGRWLLMWSCAILPLSRKKLGDWKTVLIYSIAAFCVMGLIVQYPLYYADTPLGIAAGALCGYWALQSNKWGSKYLKYIVSLLGLTLIFLMKDELGKIFCSFTAFFIVINNIQKLFNLSKKNNISSKDLLYEKILTGVISIFTLAVVLIFTNNVSSDKLISYIARFLSVKIILAIIILLTLTILTSIIYRRKKDAIIQALQHNNNLKILLLIFGAIVFVTIFYKLISIFYSSLVYDDQMIFYQSIEAVLRKAYFNKPVFKLVGLLLIMTSVISIFIIKPKYKKSLILQTSLMVLFVLGYALFLMFSYATHIQGGEISYTFPQLHRYLGAAIIIPSLWFSSFLILNNTCWKKVKAQIICIALLMSLFMHEFTLPGTTMFANMSTFLNSTRYGLRKDLREHSEFIKAHTNVNDRVFVVSQVGGTWDSFSSVSWLRYELIPQVCKGNALYQGERRFLDGNYSCNYTSNEWSDILKKQFDYVYIYYADDEFYSTYSDLFDSKQKPSTYALFRITPDGENLLELAVSKQ